MLKNDFKIAFRNLLKHKGYVGKSRSCGAGINIAGLAIGIAACLLIVLWVRDELGYDRFHAKADRTYRALWQARFGENEWKIPLVPVTLAENLDNEFPEVERTVRLRQGALTLRRGDKFVREEGVLLVEPSFFDIFTVEFIAGDRETALNDPEAVILTTEAAQRYFPNQEPLGQTLEVDDGRLLHVTAVVKPFPTQSHFHFDFLAPIKRLSRFDARSTQRGSATAYTYLTLQPGENAADLQAKLQTYAEKDVSRDAPGQTGNDSRFLLQPLLDIHLRSHLQYELEANGNLAYVYLFSAVALFILLLACINFVNLATARAIKRAQEVGIRKTLGSQRVQLIRQFLTETFVYVALAILLALVLAEMILPFFSRFAGKQLAIDYFNSPFVLATIAGLALSVTILAGAYPAFFLSSFWPVQAIKGRLAAHSGKDRLRKGLVVAQFCISIAMIIGTLVVYQQLHYFQNKRLGYDKEHVLVIHRADALGDRHLAFKNRLVSQAHIANVAAAQNLPGQTFDATVFLPEQPANYRQTSLTYAWVDAHYIDVLKLNVVAGRNFSPEFVTDSSAFLINRSAAEALGWDEPLGKHLNMGNLIQGPVVGVVEDFHFESLHHEVKPFVFLFNRWQPAYLAVRLRPGDVEASVAAIRDLWHEFAPNTQFEFSFLDQDYQALYGSEKRMADVFLTFSALAILIACLGLFGLASFMAEQRTKEIGVRKVFGATVANVTALLSKDFVKLVLAANLIAWPVAWLAMNRWLQNFAYRIEISWWVFLLAGGLALLIALLTVSTQAIRAALANPVEALRYE